MSSTTAARLERGPLARAGRLAWHIIGIALAVMLVGWVAVFAGLIALVVPPFVSRLGDLGTSVQGGLQRLAYSLRHDLAGMDHAAVDDALDRAATTVREQLGGLAGGAAAVLVALVAEGVGSTLVVLAAIVAVVLLAVAVGGTIAGLAGAFLAVPVATVAAVALGQVREGDGADGHGPTTRPRAAT